MITVIPKSYLPWERTEAAGYKRKVRKPAEPFEPSNPNWGAMFDLHTLTEENPTDFTDFVLHEVTKDLQEILPYKW